MRLRIELISKCNPIILPVNYQYHVASLLYRAIERADKDLSFELHHAIKYKPFTFSWILGENRSITKQNLRFNSDRVHFFVSSPKKEIVIAILNGLLEAGEIYIAGRRFSINEIRVLKEPRFRNGRWYLFSTISPVLVRTGRLEYGKLKHIDLLPTDRKFYENLVENLRRKWEHYTGEKERKNIEIKVLSFAPKRIKIKENWHRCALMQFLARGPSKLIKFAYQIGWGEKNSMGFGMVRAG